MKVLLQEVESGELIEAIISNASQKDMPARKNGWQFTWKKLGKTEGADFYKITTVGNPEEIEGMLMLTLINEEILYMNNIEVAPHNYGSNGKYSNVAGGLLAFACYKSFGSANNVRLSK